MVSWYEESVRDKLWKQTQQNKNKIRVVLMYAEAEYE